MSTEWFRNVTWDEAVERQFQAKLRRARRKGQYLRVQACTLASVRPDIALQLLEQYYALGVEFDLAQAHVHRATALRTLGRLDESIDAYEAALAREEQFPQVQTQAWIELPYLIATEKLRDRFARAAELLERFKTRLTFPVDHFRWHAVMAVIAVEQQNMSAARKHAREALAAAACDDSGLRYHPTVGLVLDGHAKLIRDLEGILAQ